MSRASTAAHDRVIASVNRPEAAPGADPLRNLGLDDPPALLTNRVAAVAGIAAFLNRVTSKGSSTRPDRADLSAGRSLMLPDEPAREILMAMHGDHAS